MSDTDLNGLSKKFPEEDIEWRIQQCGEGKKGYWALIIPYITNRAIMQRLDDVVGVGNWKNEFKATPCQTGYQCGISIKIDGEWVTRWDGSEVVGAGNIDKVKSTMSSAMKRAGVQWGIGRYLYQLEAVFAVVEHCDSRYNIDHGFAYHENKKKNQRFQWKAPKLEQWALPLDEREINNYLKLISEVKNLEELRFAWQEAYKLIISENDDELMKKFTKAKDDAKDRINKEQEEQVEGHTAKLDSFVDKQVVAFGKIPNEASVTSFKNSLLKELIEKSKNTKVNIEPLKSKIEKSYNNRINELEGK